MMINGDNTMIYPPIKDVVKKLGDDCSRYDLVIAAAKRARAIAKKNKEEKKDEKNAVKPITRAVREIMEDDFYIIHADGNDESAPIPDTGDMVINLNSEEELYAETDEENGTDDEKTEEAETTEAAEGENNDSEEVTDSEEEESDDIQ